MRILRYSILSLLVGVLTAGQSPAAIITYDVRGTNGDFDFNAQTGTFTDTSGGVSDGLQITIASFVAGVADGQVNATGTSLGVNAGPTIDDTDQLDGDAGLESLTFSFNNLASIASVTLTEIDILGFAGGDAGTLDIGGSSGAIASGTSTVIPGHGNLEGNSFSIAYTGTVNGFGITSLSFDVIPAAVAAVPEPNSVAMLGLLSAGFSCYRLRRRRNR